MDFSKQHTLIKEYSFEGNGLHTGRMSRMTLCPAGPDSGITFVRLDLPQGENTISASADNVTLTRRSTTLASGKASVKTVEHLLSALYALGVDNATVRMSQAEAPILDGSSKPYADAISADGLEEQSEPRKFIVIADVVNYKDEATGSEISILPADKFETDVTIDFHDSVIGVQKAYYEDGMDFTREIAPCRTFCFLHEIMHLLLLGLIRGGSLDDAIVVCDRPVSGVTMWYLKRVFGVRDIKRAPEGYLSNVKLHFDNECARHKLLDVIGDFALAGHPIKGRIVAYKPGHKINTTAVKLLMDIYHDNNLNSVK
jgi:UDP-3-O-[3-hydroxymyristoyl] N-acetylglucosamine deacetylase/3-hydroxyacyl-[acyl-carrier-protein] dehydratase